MCIRYRSCADATFVKLNVQALVVVICGVYGANRFAGSVFAVLTHDGNESSLDVGVFSFPVTLHTYPFVGPLLYEIFFHVDG